MTECPVAPDASTALRPETSAYAFVQLRQPGRNPVAGPATATVIKASTSPREGRFVACDWPVVESTPCRQYPT